MPRSTNPRSYLREWAKWLVSSYSSFLAIAAVFLELTKATHWFGESAKIWVTIVGGIVGLMVAALFARENFRETAKKSKEGSDAKR